MYLSITIIFLRVKAKLSDRKAVIPWPTSIKLLSAKGILIPSKYNKSIYVKYVRYSKVFFVKYVKYFNKFMIYVRYFT